MEQDQQDSARRRQAVAYALAQQRLEGLGVPPEVVDDLQRAARGELSVAAGIAAVYHRFGQDLRHKDGRDGDT